MPNRDHTGPCGNGAKTGKGRGNCDSNTRNEDCQKRGQGKGKGNRCCEQKRNRHSEK